MFPPLLDRVIVLTGPTASGKSQLALELAEALQQRDGVAVEILSLDSIAVYRDMDIGTAKPTTQQRTRVRHHLIDLVSPDKSFSVAQYLQAAHATVQQVTQAGRRVMFVGGSPMYLKAVLRGFCPGPPADETFRRDVESEVQRTGPAALHQRLQQVDPLSASKIDPNDVRRMIRALEFARQTGRPISHHQVQFEVEPRPGSGAVFAIQIPRPMLHERIAARVASMLNDGLVEEVDSLLARYGELSATAAQAVGYRELIAARTTGDDPFAAAEQIVTNTRRLARRQETWLRSFPEIRPVPVDPQTATGSKSSGSGFTPRPARDMVESMLVQIPRPG